MLRFAREGIVPPGGRYFFEVEGMSFVHPERHMLIRQVENFYIQNQKEIPADLEKQIQDHMCRRLPAGFCAGSDDGLPRKKTVTLADIRSKTLALISGVGYADPGIAKERAIICVKCAMNDRSACPSCTGLVAWGTRQVGNRTVDGYSDILGICELDGCLMSAGIFAKNTERHGDAPESCWRGRV